MSKKFSDKNSKELTCLLNVSFYIYIRLLYSPFSSRYTQQNNDTMIGIYYDTPFPQSPL